MNERNTDSFKLQSGAHPQYCLCPRTKIPTGIQRLPNAEESSLLSSLIETYRLGPLYMHLPENHFHLQPRYTDITNTNMVTCANDVQVPQRSLLPVLMRLCSAAKPRDIYYKRMKFSYGVKHSLSSCSPSRGPGRKRRLEKNCANERNETCRTLGCASWVTSVKIKATAHHL